MSLVDNWVLDNASKEKLNYGALRSFGALSYALASFALGFILPKTGVEFAFYANAVFPLPVLLMILFTKTANDQAAGKKSLKFSEMQFSKIFKNYYLISYIILTSFHRVPFH